MKRGRRGPAFGVVLVLLLIGVAWFNRRERRVPKIPPDSREPAASDTSSPVPRVQVPQVAIVIDDVAYNTTQMDHFASLGIPLTFAILPRHKLARPLAEKAKGLQFDVMLHLPMEPHDMANFNPGPAGLLLSMSDTELKAQFDKAVDSVPGLVGINNHMGSAFTESEPKMTLVLDWAKQRGLFFLDSYTSKKSAVLTAANKVGIPCLRNEIFLDNEDSVDGIEKQLDAALRLAVKRKRAIAIGHYRRKHIIEALTRKIPEFKNKGIEFVTLSTFYST